MKVVIVGAGGHGLVVADILIRMREASEPVELVAFVDDHPVAGLERMLGVPIVRGGLRTLFAIAPDGAIVAIGNNAIRRRLSDEIRRSGLRLAIARHPSSVVAPDVLVGQGTVICAGAVVNPGACIGVSVILNTSSSVDHHNSIGDCAHIAPGVHLGGDVSIGEESLIGIGSSVIPRTRIGARVVVGAGSVVTRDLLDDAVAYGVPARLRRTPRPVAVQRPAASDQHGRVRQPRQSVTTVGNDPTEA